MAPVPPTFYMCGHERYKYFPIYPQLAVQLKKKERRVWAEDREAQGLPDCLLRSLSLALRHPFGPEAIQEVETRGPEQPVAGEILRY